jgi:Ca-activated chloride channel homolog
LNLGFQVVFLLLVTPGLATAQRTEASPRDSYKLLVDVNLTSVLATVTTPEGALVSDLKPEDFEILENGQPQAIAIFGKELDQSLRLSLLFDSSFSISTEIKNQQEAALEFLRSILRPSDRVSVFQVSDEVQELVHNENRLQRLETAVRSIRPRGGTSLYDAVYMASEGLAKAQGRKVIVVISDGTDTTSQVKLKDCLKMSQNSEAVVYALVVQPIKSEPGRNLAGEHAMIYLTERTGGRFFIVSTPEALRTSFATISDELRTQYYIAYYPKSKGPQEEYRKIEIRVSNSSYQVRHREGYYTTK